MGCQPLVVLQFSLPADPITPDDCRQYGNHPQTGLGEVGAREPAFSSTTLWRRVPQDLVKAHFWSVLAQAGGDEASKYRVAVLASRMNRAQIAAAQQLANDWIKEQQSVSQNSPAPQ